MDFNNHWIGFAWLDPGGCQKPALNAAAVAGPGHAARGSCGNKRRIGMGQAIVDTQFSDRAGGNVLRMGIILDQRGRPIAARIERNIGVAGADRRRRRPQRAGLALRHALPGNGGGHCRR